MSIFIKIHFGRHWKNVVFLKDTNGRMSVLLYMLIYLSRSKCRGMQGDTKKDLS